MKLQKYLAHAGVCSRRKAEEYIRNGSVFVNGEVAHIGQVIDPSADQVRMGDDIIKDQQELVYYKYNKPRWIVTSCADSHETAIMDVVDIAERVFPVGRLDKNTTGLVLLTNDGRITHQLLHPSYDHQKEYHVEVYGKISDEALKIMEEGVNILGKKTKKCEIFRMNTGSFRIILTEGRNRQIRRMVEQVGHEVKRLKRIRVENVTLGNLPLGAYAPLSNKEKQTLLGSIGVSNIGDADTPLQSISGVVVRGDGRGKKLGFPTANILLGNKSFPDKTYYCHVYLDGDVYDGAGVCMAKKGVFEVHILGFDADIYGSQIEVDIVDTLRDNRAFSSQDDLVEQIEKDIQKIQEISTLYDGK